MLNNFIKYLDYIILTKCWLESCIINLNIDGFKLYKTSRNNFNQNSGLVVIVNINV